MRARSAGSLLVALALFSAVGAARGDVTLVALTESGSLLVFPADHPEAAKEVRVRSVSGSLVGIDLRPADQRIYGLATTNELYSIDSDSGDAKLVSSLTVPFDGGTRSGIDFNPQADRLRLVSAAGQNLRVNVAIGATAVDRAVAYAPGDPNAGKRPGITASAYSNSRPGAAETKLFNLDTARNVLTVQDPPNDGVQVTVGYLGVDLGPLAGFEIVTDPSGQDRAFAAAGFALFSIDLRNGAARLLGRIGAGNATVISLTSAGDR
jgi:uncharacterized protein DUF4394